MKKKISILAAVFVLVTAVFLWKAYAAKTPQVPLAGNLIPQFAQPLPLLSFTPGVGMYAHIAGLSPFSIYMREFQANILPDKDAQNNPWAPPAGWGTDGPGTWVWGYLVGPTPPSGTQDTYIGPVIVATRNQASQIKFVNALGNVRDSKVLAWKYSTDQTLHWADPAHSEANPYLHPPAGSTFHPYGTPGSLNYGEDPANPGTFPATFLPVPIPAVVHLHGGEVPPMLDGGPDSWVMSFQYDGYAMSGHGYYTAGGAQGDTATENAFQYNYPNTQEAANIWFHDHVLGITRLNVYAGMAGAYVLVDSLNPPPPDLNDPTLIVPVVIQDRMFDTNGQLFFPADSAGNVLWATNPEHPYWVPEFLGDVIVVNGKAWPYLDVKPARYRLLFINGSNARTYEMWVSNPITGARAPWWVIGTDGGYLDKPVKINKLTMMPGERYDVIIDFTGLSTGTPANDYFILRNNARTPFPKGVPPKGATVGQIMQFRVNPNATTADLTFNPANGGNLRPNNPVVRLPGTPGGPNVQFTRPIPAADDNVQVKRQLTLNEVMGLPQVVEDPVVEDPNNPGFGLLTAYPGGPLEVVLNNTKWSGIKPDGMTPTGSGWEVHDAGLFGNVYYSELPQEGTTEQWEIINITADAHPIHLHLVQFQVMNRQNFDFNKYMNAYAAAFGGIVKEAFGPPNEYGVENTDGALGGNPPISPYLKGKAVPPAAEEQGWKDTVISYPGQVLRLSVRWAPTDLLNTTAPADAFFPFDPNHGHGYVWHCHIIDHEDNEMMRPTSVLPNPSPKVKRTIVPGDY